jgi:hypothetical protein
MAFETTRQEILKQAIELKKLYDSTRIESYKDQELRLRRIVVELDNLTVGASDLNSLTDVTISSPTNGQVLTYNSTTSQWENQAGGGGGGSGYVPYTGATGDVNLGTHQLLAARGTFSNNGSTDTLTVNHTSGSGYGVVITKGGNNEALYVNKTSGSGNAMTVVGGRTSLVDLALSSVSNAAGDFLTLSGGVVHRRTAAQVLSDISVPTPTLAQVTTAGNTTTNAITVGGLVVDTNTLVVDSVNNKVGIGTTTPFTNLDVVGPSGRTTFTGNTRLGLTISGATAQNDYSGIDFVSNSSGVNTNNNPLGRIAMIATSSGSILEFGASNSYATGITRKFTFDWIGRLGVNVGSRSLSGYAALFGDGTETGYHYIGLKATAADLYIGQSAGAPFALAGPSATILSNLGSVFSIGTFNIAAFVLGTSNVERARFTAGGNLLIGTTTDAGYKLDVNGTARVQGAFTATLANVSTANVVYYNTTTGLFTYGAAPGGGGGGTVTSVGLSSATSGVTIGATPVTTSGTITIAIATAATAQNGLLSSTDWNTFNGKQAALSGTGFVKISGTTISYDNSTYYLASNPSGYTTNVGTVTSVGGTGTVSGLTLSGTVTSSGNLTLGGTLTLTSGNVTTALGFTPYNATNPAGYTTNTGTVTSVGLSSATSGVTIGATPVTTSGTITIAIATASGSQNGLLSSTNWTTFNNKQNAISLTTTGTSGAATFVSNTLNIPNYTLAGLGYSVPTLAQVTTAGNTTTNAITVGGLTVDTNTLVVDATNNRVGIGTATPTDKLHIIDSSNANIFGRITATGTNASAAWVAQNDQTDNVVYRVFGSGVSGSQMGISLVRSASLLANLGGSGKFLVGTFSSTDFVLGTGNTERARFVDSTGNFLIGTTTDNGNRLQVSGTIDGQAFAVNGVNGWTGTIMIIMNPPGMQNIQVDNGIITNVF